VVADLHCHYPMHLLTEERRPHHASAGWAERLKNELESGAEGVLARLLNDPSWESGWRVDLDRLVQGGVGIVCSALYSPPDEFDLGSPYGSPPAPGYFSDLRQQLQRVEDDLAAHDPDGQRHVLVRSAADLDDEERVRFVHCVEGGFHLGAEHEIEANVRWLAEHGVIYVTLAHLFFRGVATNAPAIPLLSDHQYDDLFPQDANVGLTELGARAVRAMYASKVLVDISHMRQRAIDDTFELVGQLDRDSGTDPRDYPLIASHIGVRSVGPDDQQYNLSPETIWRIRDRGGVMGVILAQHQLGKTADEERSRVVLRAHIDAIAAEAGGHGFTGIGTDLDGFIKPTLAALETASDLSKLEGWIRADYPDDADAILCGNARGVLQRVLAARGAA
jgi:microsomal dipeptidase-like Zn-dependent dipeptidase